MVWRLGVPSDADFIFPCSLLSPPPLLSTLLAQFLMGALSLGPPQSQLVTSSPASWSWSAPCFLAPPPGVLSVL